ncbi:MAG: hypothetical protein GY719_33870 [bacterium]|nr:hypothetical protein [bacterium]
MTHHVAHDRGLPSTPPRRRTPSLPVLTSLLICLWWPGTAVALERDKHVTQYLHELWRGELPHATVQDVLRTADGYLWLATQEGLVRYDGVSFTIFTPSDTPELGDAHVLTLYEDARGTLWIGTRGGGLTTYRDRSFAATDAPAKVILNITGDRSGNLWLGTPQGLLRFDGRQWALFDRDSGLPEDAVRAVLEDSAGNLWVGTRGSGLGRLREGRYVPAIGSADPTIRDLFHGLGVICLLDDGRGGLWIGTRGRGLLHLRDGTVEALTTADGLGADTVVDLWLDRHDHLWIATYGGGLNRFDGGEVVALTSDHHLTSDIILALWEDLEGSLWVGTSGGGLSRLRDGAVTAWTTHEGLPSNNTYCVLEDRSGVMWIGTEGGGLGRLEGRGITALTTADGLSSNSVTALLEDRDGSLWIGTRDAGLNRLRDGRITRLTRSDGSSGDSIFSLLEDRAGRLWAGTVRSGLRTVEDGRLVQYRGDPDLDGSSIFALALDVDGNLLIGTDGAGLKTLGPGGITTLTTADGLSNDTVVALAADSEGTIWAGTYGGGLHRIRGREVVSIGTGDGLFDDRVFQILDDGAGRLWMSSNRGIFSVAKRELEAFSLGRAPRVTSIAIGKEHGMLSTECAAGTQPAGWCDSRGSLWFPTAEGVVSLDPEDLRPNPVAPPVHIESVLVDGEPLSPSDEARLGPGHERLEFSYAGLGLRVPEMVRFRYQLEGFDRGWVEAGGARSTTFTNLPTGKSYRFVVTAANEDGVWNPRGASFSFYVEPHFYETPAFLALSGSLVALLGWGAYRARTNQLHRRTQALERTVAERTAEVVAEKERVESANLELAKLNRIKSEFLAIAAHDLKNPLTVIYGHAGKISKGVREEGRVRRMGRSIFASIDQMLNIIDDLLDSTAIETGKLRLRRTLTDLATLAAEAVESNHVRAAERDIRLVFTVDLDEDYDALVDADRIGRVFDNLISNAVKFSQDHSSVDVTLERIDSDSSTVSRSTVLRFSVRDQGPGLSTEDQAKLFRRFERLSAAPVAGDSSSGLGLSIVKQFTEMHGGYVQVVSRLGRGSTFLVDLPAEDVEAPGEK